MKSNLRSIIYGLIVICLLLIGYNLLTFEKTADVTPEDVKDVEKERESEEPVEMEKEPEPKTTPPKSATKDDYRKWVLDRSPDEFNGKRNITAAVDSENITKAWLDTTRPAFIIRCLDDKTEVLLNTRHQFEVEPGHTEEVKISYTIDDRQPVSEYWRRGPEGKTAFANDPESFAKQLSGVKVLRIEFTPFNADTATAVFDIQGSEKVVNEISSACELGN